MSRVQRPTLCHASLQYTTLYHFSCSSKMTCMAPFCPVLTGVWPSQRPLVQHQAWTALSTSPRVPKLTTSQADGYRPGCDQLIDDRPTRHRRRRLDLAPGRPLAVHRPACTCRRVCLHVCTAGEVRRKAPEGDSLRLIDRIRLCCCDLRPVLAWAAISWSCLRGGNG